MTTKSMSKKSAQKTVSKPTAANKNSKSVAPPSSKKSNKNKAEVFDSESEAEAFFQDSDDAEMDWSEVDSDEESFDEENIEGEFLSSEDEEDFDSEEEILDSEDEEAFDSEDDDAEFVEVEDDEVEEVEVSDSESIESENLKEKYLNVPTDVSHAKNPLMEFFWKLAETDKAVRMTAVADLIEHIKSGQAAFVAPVEAAAGGKGEKILSLYDGGLLASRCCSDLTYTIKRLIKGLASSRDSARIGFMLALLAVYHSFADLLDAEVIFSWSIKLTAPEALGGSVKKREERLLYVARTFALAALFRSGLGNNGNLSAASKTASIDALVSIAKKKSFLRESSLEVILFGATDVESSRYALKKLAAASGLMTETLAFAIHATSNLGFDLEAIKSEGDRLPEFFSEFTNHRNLLAVSNEEPLLNILKETACFENRLHSIWTFVLGSLDKEGCMTAEEFLKKVIESMFLNSVGLVKRWTGFMLLKRLIEANQTKSIGFVFTPIVVRMIKGSLGTLNAKSSVLAGKEVSAFNAAVSQYFRNIIVSASESASSNIAMDMIVCLSKIPSGVAGKNLLEDITGDEAIIAKLYANLNSGNVMALIDIMAKDISFESAKTQSLVAFQAPFDKLIGLLKNEKLIKLEGSAEWISHLTSIMANLCVSEPEMSSEVRDVVNGRFFALLSELTDSKRFAGINWIENVSKLFLAAASGSKSATFKIEVDEPTADALENLKAIEKLLAKNKIEPERFSQAVRSLQNYLSILIFVDPVDCIPVCAELAECLEAHFSKSNKKSSKTQSSLDAVMPVILDILMTFLSKSSQMTRKMCDDIFRSVIPFLSSESLAVLFQILKTVDSGKEELFEEVDDEAMEDEDESDVEEDGEMMNAIAAATSSNQVSRLEDSEESELSDVDDEQMLAFDEKLAEIFREKRKAQNGSSKARSKASKRTMIQFKFKVLELVNLAFKSGDLQVPVRVTSIKPILEIIFANISLNGNASTPEQKQFFAKLEVFFTEAFGRSPRNAIEADASGAEFLIIDIIDKICGEDKMFTHAAILPKAAQAVWFLLKLCRTFKFDESNVTARFGNLVKFAVSADETRFRVLRSFIFTWSNWDLKCIAPLLAENSEQLTSIMAVGAIRPFQRNQLFEFLTSLIKRAQAFNVQESAVILLQLFSRVFSDIYASTLSTEIKTLKVDFFKDDLKFIQFCSKKHLELEGKSGAACWEAVNTAGMKNIEEFWAAQPNPTNAVKSFLGQLKSSKQ